MTAIGIDLGTTNSVAAISDKEGRARTLKNHKGESFTPSVVSVKDGELLVGREARNHAAAAPKDTIFSVKRLMGRPYDHPRVAEAKERFLYAIVPADEDGFACVYMDGRQYKPEDISAEILKRVLADAEKEVGQEIRYAVITVPAYFSEPQREATRKAGEMAGLVVKKIIDEPTAAAVAFGLDKAEEDHTIMVFDMGGGTLDVSVLFYASREFTGLAKEGDMWLGGDDFDQKIVELINEWVKSIYPDAPLDDDHFRLEARREAEKAKILLSNNPATNVLLPGIIPLPGGQSLTVNMQISRQQFEERTQPLVEVGRRLIDKVLRKRGLEPEDITAVLPIGGSTLVPAVRHMLEEQFGPEKIRADVDPMNAVALGAAIMAATTEGVECPKCKTINKYEATRCENCAESLSMAEEIGSVNLYDVTERHLGIGAVDRQKGDADVFSILIKAGTHYPLEEPARRRYKTTGRQITIPVYIGEKEKASDNEYLGLVEYELPAGIGPGTPIWVAFNFDRNRILNVKIEVEGRPDLAHEATPRRHMPRPGVVREDQWITILHNAVNSVEEIFSRYGEFVPNDKKQNILDIVQHAKAAIAAQDQAAGHQLVSDLTQAAGDLDVAIYLLLADRLRGEATPDSSGYLAEQQKLLKEALRKQDSEQVRNIKRALEAEFKHIQETMPVSRQIESFGGLPEILPDAS